MKTLSAVALLIASMTFAMTAAAETDRSYLNGADYLSLTPDQRTAYIIGLADMMSRMSRAVDDAGEIAFQERVRRCAGDKGRVELREFIDAYMAQDPAFKEYGMASNFRAAFNEKCPQ